MPSSTGVRSVRTTDARAHALLALAAQAILDVELHAWMADRVACCDGATLDPESCFAPPARWWLSGGEGASSCRRSVAPAFGGAAFVTSASLIQAADG